MKPAEEGRRWRGPTIQEIAELAGVGPATVDRVVNGRKGVRDTTRDRVLSAIRKLSHPIDAGDERRIGLLCESGATFNRAMAAAVSGVNRSLPGVEVSEHYAATNELDPARFANEIVENGLASDGIVLVAREHPAINHAVRKLRKHNIPVVCLTTDLPSSRRNVYVGNDQYAAGSVAALLIGHALADTQRKILLVMSVAFRCQQEREMGFRRALRSDFPDLRIEERVVSDDAPETTFERMHAYFQTQGVPAAIYNLAGGNRGVAQALEASGAQQDTIFIGHELTSFSQQLLEEGTLNYVISHDFTMELTLAIRSIDHILDGVASDPNPTPIYLHTRYNCNT